MRLNINILLVVSFALLFLFTNLYAQSEQARLVSAPRPDIPEAAKKTGIGGKVSVLVTVDRDGNVSEVKNVFGPDSICPTIAYPDIVALRESARSAALNAKFTAATRDGKPVASDEIIDFTFARSDSRNKNLASTEKIVAGDVKGQSTPPQGNSIVKPDTKTANLVKGTVISMPKPPYPVAGRAVRASGVVAVEVMIDENGSVYSADAISGHPLLRPAATLAACKAQFTETLLEGKPIKVSAIITYNFVP